MKNRRRRRRRRWRKKKLNLYVSEKNKRDEDGAGNVGEKKIVQLKEAWIGANSSEIAKNKRCTKSNIINKVMQQNPKKSQMKVLQKEDL